jgi:broad specificity phosphatase PhoE
MTTVFFLRHGPTQENKEGRIQGQQPGTLLLRETEGYISAIVPLLRQKNPTILICSDLERAVRTCTILKETLGIADVKQSYSPLLREKAMGFYEGMLWAEVPAEFQEQRGQSNYDFRKFGGENDSDVQYRVREMLRRLAQEYPNQRVACITHAGWIRQLVSIADKEGMLPDGWSNRTAIYEGGIGPIGQLQYFHPITIEAQLSTDEED